ncbi:MAG: hypothetical protein ABI193_16520 [Minicystis sp.]
MTRALAVLGGALVAGSLLFAAPLAAAPKAGAAKTAPRKKDAQAEKALKKALDQDFLETRFDDAENRLRGAIQACGANDCSPALLARIHAALGSVLAGGKKELQDAQDAFIDALNLDPSVQPDPDISSAEVGFAFEQAQKKLKLGKAGAPAATDAGPKSDDAADKAPEPTPEEKKPAAEPERNWLSLAFIPDLTFVSGTEVCTKESQRTEHYYCARQDGSHYVGTPTAGNGDNVNGGVALSTMRATIGYARLVGDHVTFGARVGFAFNGASGDAASFVPFHGEGRIAFWPTSAPFSEAGVRPFVFVGGGYAQIDTKVEVEVLEDGRACGALDPTDTASACTKASGKDGAIQPRKQTLSAYKQTGLGFASIGGGVQFSPTRRVGIDLGVRASLTFPVTAPVISPEAGISVGF